MAQYTVQDTSTGKTITFDWNDTNPPTDADMEDVFAQAKSYKPEQSSTQQMSTQNEKTGFKSLPGRAVDFFKNKKYKDMDFPAAGETALAIGTGIPATVLGGLAGIKSLPYGINTASKVSQGIQKALTYSPRTEGGKDLTELVSSPFIAAQAVGGEIQSKAEKEGYPLLGTLGNIATQSLPVLLGGRKALQKTSPISEQTINSVIDEGINKAIRPSIAKKEVRGQVDAYKERTQTAVKEIINNKDNLQLADAQGAKVEGLPKTLDQFSQAIDQTKQKIFEEYDTLAQGAGNVDLQPIAAELNNMLGNKVLNDLSPETIKYAEQRMDALSNRGAYTATEAQEAIQTLNQSLKNYYENPSMATKGQALVDSMIANKMREQLDVTIQQATGADYQGLKNTYGALRTLEKDVTKRSIVDARKNVKGFFDMSDIYSGYHVIKGLLSKEPSTMIAGAGAKVISAYYKWKNNPNNIVADMFRKTDELINNKSTIQSIPTNPAITFNVKVDGKEMTLTEENGQLVIKK